MNTGMIFNIQHFSLHDGPGIRTTVFLKGCPLDCIWCHNPESKKHQPQLAWEANRCIKCGLCEAVCDQGVHHHSLNADGQITKVVDHTKCITCGRCVEACPSVALEILGRLVSVEDVIQEVAKDIPFYQTSKGGLTLSGGDPCAQPDFAAALLRRAKAMGIHTAIETAGYAAWKEYEKMLPHLDMILYDIKQMDPQKHLAYTGKTNTIIHENLKRLCKAEQRVEIVVRTPVIPGFNDDLENYIHLAEFLQSMERRPRVEVLPYNPLAGSKHPRIGQAYKLDLDEKDGTSPDSLCAILKDAGIAAVVMR